MMNKRGQQANVPRQTRSSFAFVCPGLPVTAVAAHGIIYTEDVCAHVGAHSPTHVSFMKEDPV